MSTEIKKNLFGRYSVRLTTSDEIIGFIYDYVTAEGAVRFAYHPNDIRRLDYMVVRDINAELERLNAKGS
jgi:hypothetical protein